MRNHRRIGTATVLAALVTIGLTAVGTANASPGGHGKEATESTNCHLESGTVPAEPANRAGRAVPGLPGDVAGVLLVAEQGEPVAHAAPAKPAPLREAEPVKLSERGKSAKLDATAQTQEPGKASKPGEAQEITGSPDGYEVGCLLVNPAASEAPEPQSAPKRATVSEGLAADR